MRRSADNPSRSAGIALYRTGSAGDSVAIVGKYVTKVIDSTNTAVAAYVQARLAALGG